MARTKRKAELAALRKLFGDVIIMRTRLLENAERSMLTAVGEVKRRQYDLDEAISAQEKCAGGPRWRATAMADSIFDNVLEFAEKQQSEKRLKAAAECDLFAPELPFRFDMGADRTACAGHTRIRDLPRAGTSGDGVLVHGQDVISARHGDGRGCRQAALWASLHEPWQVDSLRS